MRNGGRARRVQSDGLSPVFRIVSIVEDGFAVGKAAITTNLPNGLVVGQTIRIEGSGVAAYNGASGTVDTVLSAVQFTSSIAYTDPAFSGIWRRSA